jgi:hypothetical protein
MAMIGQKALLSSIIAAALLSSGFFGFYLGTNRNSAVSDTALIDSSISEALKNDEVIVRVHDSAGNLKYEEKEHNIITSAGAIYFCVQMNRCESHITGESPNVASAAGPTWWVQFISGTPNTNRPTAADCSAPSGGGDLTGQTSGSSGTLRCVTNFGASPAQYQAGGSVLTVSLTSGSGQLRGVSGTYDTTNNFVRTTEATVCSIINDGTAPASGTCQFTDTTPVLTNMSGGSITVSGLALGGGDGSTTAAGPLIIAESDISDVTLANGDTISVSWTIVT